MIETLSELFKAVALIAGIILVSGFGITMILLFWQAFKLILEDD